VVVKFYFPFLNFIIMKLKTVCFISLTVVVLMACNKKNEPVAATDVTLSDILKINNIKVDGGVTLTATSYSFSKDPVTQIDIQANLKDAQGKLVKCETALVGGIELAEQGNVYTKHFSVLTNGADMPRLITDLFGKSLSVNLKSAQYGDVITSLYAPTPIKLELSNDKTKLLNTEDGLTIRWKPDTDQMQRTVGQVGAMIQYHAGFSVNQDNATLPRENVCVYKAASDSDGEVTFSTQELNRLPRGGTVVVYLARAQQSITTNANNRTTATTILSHSSSKELLVQ
jgi:hypothetical protein